MKYDTTIRVMIAFFAALIGFGLKNLLDLSESDALFQYRIQLFLISIFLFLRFLTGAANHMWVEHVMGEGQARDRLFFTLDILFVIAFGALASLICYSNTLQDFFLFSTILFGTSLLWGLFVESLGQRFQRNSIGKWKGWLFVTLFQLIFFAGPLYVITQEPGSFLLEQVNVFTGLWVLAAISLGCFLADLWVQLENLDHAG